MRYIIVLFCLSLWNVTKFGLSEISLEKKKTFVFSGDLNLNIENSKTSELSEQKKEEDKSDKDIIIGKEEKMKAVDQSVKTAINEASKAIKEKFNINELPPSGLSEDEEEEAKEDSEFLTGDLEEAAQNFSSSDEQNDVSEEKETEAAHIKKYQAEVINSMNHDSIYKKFGADDLKEIERTMEDSEDICDQDYSLPCPLNFFRTSSGCVPLGSYEGPCNKVQDKLEHMYDNQKESWAEICDSNWPCMPLTCPYGTDYDSLCPINWMEVGKGMCRSLYINEKCQEDIQFSSKTIAEKKDFEKVCGIRWRCKSVIYKTNFDYACPLNWEKMGAYKCKAPDDYNGPCPKVANLKKYNTEEGKKNIEIACLVNWPYTIKVNEQNRDYDIPCPIGWSILSSGFCRAPENYRNSSKCSDEVSFIDMNLQQKESYSSACSVDFPFKDRNDCRRNYSFPCPMGWIPSKKDGFCKAPIGYKSKICKTYSKFKNISDGQKNYYLKFCNIDWPCEGEIRNSLIYTQLLVDYSMGSSMKWDSGPVDSETGLII
ncbi:CPW-WPC family protein, putative [Plasmodium ovale]|uniref:CPW-WPC family protein, putative n=3 Tax=Plasmodium ovale TaxID=36330 RepID=A0A1D3TKB6_PLAOA|nr:CPW-WPC family protein, putative [Plasmodium ovale]